MTRRAFLALAAGAAGVVASARALAHHKPGHNHGPNPSPSPTTTPPPPMTTTPPPPSSVVGPLLGAQGVRDGTAPHAVTVPTGAVLFDSPADLQSKINVNPNRVFGAEPGEIDWDRTVEL
jgi:hypothetical protein